MAMAHGPAPRRTHLRRFRVEATTTSITNYMVGTRAAYMYLAVVDRQTRNRGFAIWLTLGVAPRPLGGRYYASMADAMRGCLNENCIRSRIPVLYVSVVTSDQSLHVVTLKWCCTSRNRPQETGAQGREASATARGAEDPDLALDIRGKV